MRKRPSIIPADLYRAVHEDGPDFTVPEAAAVIRQSLSKTYQLIREELLKGVVYPGTSTIYVPRSALREYLGAAAPSQGHRAEAPTAEPRRRPTRAATA
jgi:hypothetical protein